MSHTAAVAWRALALLQTEIDAAKNEACRRNCVPAKQEESKPEPTTQPGGFQAGDHVTVFNTPGTVVDQPFHWSFGARVAFVAVRLDEGSAKSGEPSGYYPENVKRIPPADKPAPVPLIGGFVKGERVRVKGTHWVGVADHVSPCGKFIRMQLDGQNKPESQGSYPEELERITAS